MTPFVSNLCAHVSLVWDQVDVFLAITVYTYILLCLALTLKAIQLLLLSKSFRLLIICPLPCLLNFHSL